MVEQRKCAAAAGLPQREQLPSRPGDAVSKPRGDREIRKVGFVVHRAGLSGVHSSPSVAEWGLRQAQNSNLLSHQSMPGGGP